MATTPAVPSESAWGILDPSPKSYRTLSEPELTSELTRLSSATSINNVDCVMLQPCLKKISQDRYVAQEWVLPGGAWRFAAIFDGHSGVETIDHVVEALPAHIKASLMAALAQVNGTTLSNLAVSDLLVKSISDIDCAILREFLDLFPSDENALRALSDSDIDGIINDSDSCGANHIKVLRSMRGCTALVSLIDVNAENLFMASLGDCTAVLGSQDSSGSWVSTLVSSHHNGNNRVEAARIRDEHEGEDQCLVGDRLFGFLALTRDHYCNLSAIYTDRVFLKVKKDGFRRPHYVQKCMNRNLPPPYLSKEADIHHVDLKFHGHGARYLGMCSDGLTNLYMHDDGRVDSLENIAAEWISVVSSPTGDNNKALHLLRDALGGADEDKVSMNLMQDASEA